MTESHSTESATITNLGVHVVDDVVISVTTPGASYRVSATDARELATQLRHAADAVDGAPATTFQLRTEAPYPGKATRLFSQFAEELDPFGEDVSYDPLTESWVRKPGS